VYSDARNRRNRRGVELCNVEMCLVGTLYLRRDKVVFDEYNV